MKLNTENSGDGCQGQKKKLPPVARPDFQDQLDAPRWLAGATERPVEMVGEWVNDGESALTPFGKEHDACALMSVVNRTGLPTRANVTRTLDGLVKMSHRAGMVNGEGDPQLDVAIAELLKELETKAYVTPKRPPSPKRDGMGIPPNER